MAEMKDLAEKPRRAVVIAVQLSEVGATEFESSLAELKQLARTLGVDVVGSVTQKRGSFDSGTYLGAGKIDELKKLIGVRPKAPRNKTKSDTDVAPGALDDSFPEPIADMILVDHEITPSQARVLEMETDCEVLDRTMVILDIFQRHAKSNAAKAQVEIVRLKYMAPRMRETGKKDRQRGGIGGKGAGESAIELDRRKIRDRIAELGEEIEAMEAERKTQRARRTGQTGLERVALVGYTNAGKSTLMRALTASEVYVADKLFATLDTTVRTLSPPSTPTILVSDTVGFIKNLPHGLVASFKSTLEEALEATLVCQVIDASDEGWQRQKQVTDEVLAEIGAGDVPRLLVFNKIDKVAEPEVVEARLREHFPDAIIMSAKRPEDVAVLRQRFVDFFSRNFVETELLVPWTSGALRGEIFSTCQVLGEEGEETGARLRVRARKDVVERLQKLISGSNGVG